MTERRELYIKWDNWHSFRQSVTYSRNDGMCVDVKKSDAIKQGLHPRDIALAKFQEYDKRNGL